MPSNAPVRKIELSMKWPPSTFVFGVSVSLIASALSLGFYSKPNSFWAQPLTVAAQKSVDWRLQWRGPEQREVSDRIALLAVDETAVSSLGRWPWPRDTLAQVLENSLQLGARVVALDMVFSEAAEEKQDQALARTLQQYPDQVVLGYMPETLRPDLQHNLMADYCESLWRQESLASLHNGQIHLQVKGWTPSPLPSLLEAIFYNHLTQALVDYVENSRPTPQSALQRHHLRTEILNKRAHYCQNWLNPEKDELFETLSSLWEDLVEESPDLAAHKSYEDWVKHFRAQFPNSHSFKVAHEWILNLPIFHRATPHAGHFAADLDSDGVIRRKTLLYRASDLFLPNLALKAYLLSENRQLELEVDVNPKTQQLQLMRAQVKGLQKESEGFDLPLDSSGALWINYRGPQQSFPHISAAELLDPREEATVWLRGQPVQVNKEEFLKDKILLFGATALGIYDLRVTPFDENFPGPEIHIHLLDNLLGQDFLRIPSWEKWAMPLFLLLIGSALSLAFGSLSALWSLGVTALALMGLFFLDQLLLFNQGHLVNISLPLGFVAFLFLTTNFYNYLIAERGKRELKQTFQKYVSPSIVDEILKSPENIELGGKKQRVTVFFSDVRGFTTISEKLDPRALSDLLNSYLTPMTELVFEQKGTLDKYMGDAIMAFFGAPLEDPKHAKHACLCALKHLEKLKELQAEYAKKGLPEIDVGIGLNTGDVSVGNMGSETVRSYTVMGDTVNLASRLEGINKQYDTRIVISEFTYAEVKEEFICRELDWVRVKGKAQPVKIYELLAQKASLSPERESLLEAYHRGLTLYHERQFQAAQECFAQALNLQPDDTPCRLYLERCQNYLTTPPPVHWDGVFVMTSK